MLSCKYCKIYKNSFLHRTSLVALSGLKSNISNANLNKNEKQLFLYFDNSHTNQTDTTKKFFFFFFINSGFYLTLLSKATFSQRLSFFTVCWVSRTLKETFLKFGSPDRWKRHFQYTFLTSNYTLFITDKHNFSLWILWFRDKVHEILSPKLNRIKFKN